MVSAVALLVDARDGRKRAAGIQMAGVKARLADRLENVLTYAEDGAPAAFRSSFHFKLGWIERSAEVRSRAGRRAGSRCGALTSGRSSAMIFRSTAPSTGLTRWWSKPAAAERRRSSSCP